MAVDGRYEPVPRWGHTSVTIGDRVYMWGGRTDDFSESYRKQVRTYVCTCLEISNWIIEGWLAPGKIMLQCTSFLIATSKWQTWRCHSFGDTEVERLYSLQHLHACYDIIVLVESGGTYIPVRIMVFSRSICLTTIIMLDTWLLCTSINANIIVFQREKEIQIRMHHG